MKIKHVKKQELTYEIIRDAVNGDEEAEEIILDYYEPYIIKLSKLPYIDNEGEVAYVIDEDIYNYGCKKQKDCFEQKAKSPERI